MHRTMTMGAKAPPDPIDLCSLPSERREQRGEEAPVKLPRKARRSTRAPAGRVGARRLLDGANVRDRIGRATGRGVVSATAAAFTLSRSETTSLKARR